MSETLKSRMECAKKKKNTWSYKQRSRQEQELIWCHSNKNNNKIKINQKSHQLEEVGSAWKSFKVEGSSLSPHEQGGQLIPHRLVSAACNRHSFWKQSERKNESATSGQLHSLEAAFTARGVSSVNNLIAAFTCKASLTGVAALCLLISPWLRKHKAKCLALTDQSLQVFAELVFFFVNF